MEPKVIVKKLIQQIKLNCSQGINWYKWAADLNPKFQKLPEFQSKESKIKYFEQNLQTILLVFVNKLSIKKNISYDEFLLEFTFNLDQLTFPISKRDYSALMPEQDIPSSHTKKKIQEKSLTKIDEKCQKTEQEIKMMLQNMFQYPQKHHLIIPQIYQKSIYLGSDSTNQGSHNTINHEQADYES